jgi:hypothetical protein
MGKEDENKVSIDKSYYEDLLKNNQRPGESYNMFAALAAAAPAGVIGVDAFIKRNEAKNNLKNQQGYVDKLMQNYMNTPIYNPYENLSVATQANQIKMDETDKALANTLDTLRQTGAAAGGATALAQAALKSKAGIAADIEKQEVGNERLKAQGEIMVQNAEMQRKGQQMDYEQSKADQLRTEQFAYGERAADMAGALGSLGLQAARNTTSNQQQGNQQQGDQQQQSEDGSNNEQSTEEQDFERNYIYGQGDSGEILENTIENDNVINPSNKPLGSGFDNTAFDFDAEMAKFNDPSIWGKIGQMAKRYRELESSGARKEAALIYKALNDFKLKQGLKPGTLVQEGKYNFE